MLASLCLHRARSERLPVTSPSYLQPVLRGPRDISCVPAFMEANRNTWIPLSAQERPARRRPAHRRRPQWPISLGYVLAERERKGAAPCIFSFFLPPT